jgi:hypothetical protein
MVDAPLVDALGSLVLRLCGRAPAPALHRRKNLEPKKRK